jgi:hypothetical protein
MSPSKRPQFATLFVAACALSTGASSVFAHEGHGLHGSHWHATDSFGFVALACLAAVAIWLSRKDK